MKKKILTIVSIFLLLSTSCVACLKAVKADSNITINCSISSPNQIAGNSPPTAQDFLVVNMTITNNGYSSFDTNPAYFIMNESGDQYPNTPISYDPAATNAINNWQTVTLNNGGTFSGSLVFDYNPSVYEFGLVWWYNGTTSAGQGYAIDWNLGAYLNENAGSYTTYSGPTPIGNSAPTPTTTATNSTPATPEFPTTAILAVFLVLSLLAVSVMTIRKRKIRKS